MSVIAVLPSAVADQIAAGEVVERPASVVKELVENALDAGATSVDVAVEDGGRTLIRVSDDGCGMDANDAVLCLARHGTSKIRLSSDLAAIETFGFRGEALPAICSVSRLEIETSPVDGGGVSVRAEGGATPQVNETARRRGTTVAVANLFYNVPARLKFLRGSRSEWRAILDTMTTLALARRDVRWSLSHDGKPALTLPPASTLRERVAAVWTAKYAERLLDVDEVSGPIRVVGLAERPGDVGTATRRVYLSVNGRVIRDGGLVRAAEAAYRSTIPAGLRPSLLLELTMPADTVDVNVHPAKAEVRFLDRWGTERVVESAVRRALGTMDSAARLGARASYTFTPTPTPTPAEVMASVFTPRPAHDIPLFADPPFDDARRTAIVDDEAVGVEAEDAVRAPDDASGIADDSAPARAITQPLMQLRRTYIMFEHEDGIVLVDQHSAHERVLYERFMTMLEEGGAPSQRLLLPLTVHLSAAQMETFEANRAYLERLGYEAEEFGGNTMVVHAVPTPHPRFDAERCLRDTLAALAGDRAPGSAGRHERLASTVACKAAVKAGDALSQEEMRALLDALSKTVLPAHDVHGRSVIVRLSWAEVERRFGRQ